MSKRIKIGRKTKYQHTMCKVAYDFLAKGYSKEAVAGELGINKDTLYSWLLKHKEFSDAIEKGEAASQLFWEKLGIQGVMGKMKGFNGSVWALNMKNRFGWREKTDLGPVAQPLNIVMISYHNKKD